MKMKWMSLWCVVLLACSSTQDAPVDASPGSDAGELVDAGLDANTDTDLGVDAGSDAGMSACGTARPELEDIQGTEGLVIARDGTIYYSQQGGLGRLVPGGTPENDWVSIGAGIATVWGLALDEANETIYVGSPGDSTIYQVTVATGESDEFYPSAGAPNGLTMGQDGVLYYSDFGGNQVYRIDTASGVRTRVTTSSISQPNGVVFGPDARLYVVSYSAGTLLALTLEAGAETARETIAGSLGNPDGVAFDASGQIYIGDNGGDRLLRLDADGTNPMVLASSVFAAANVEFGVGVLNCSDIYVASSGELRRYEMGSTVGADVLWH